MTKNVKLSNHIRQLILAVGEREARIAMMLERERSGALPRLTANAGPEELTQWAQENVAAFDECSGDMYYRVDLHANAILKLTDAPAIVGPVRVIADRMAKESSDMHDLISEVERVTSVADKLMVLMKMVGLAARWVPRQGELDAAVAELESAA